MQVGYHTCKLENGYDYIVEKIPFISRNGNNQWLGQGFYFWTDSSYWAQRWGVEGNRVIGKFTIELCLQSELLDLVGNVSHQEEFIEFQDLILNKLTAAQKSQITVNQIINKLRQEGKAVFPYLAVKAQDTRHEHQLDFIKNVSKSPMRAVLKLITRQQMCVFEDARDRIKLCGFLEPAEFAERMSAT